MDRFRELYERYYPDVYRFALFLTGDVARAEDLTADTRSCARGRLAGVAGFLCILNPNETFRSLV